MFLSPTAAWTNYKLRKVVERTEVSKHLAKLTDDIAAADEALALLVATAKSSTGV